MSNWILWYGYGHIPFHFVIPLVIYRYRKDRVELALLELANAIDLDHLLAPITFDPMRCSLTTHPLHSGQAVLCYAAICFVPRVRALGFGALLHLLIDAPNCL